MLISLFVIRMGVRVLQVAFGDRPWVRWMGAASPGWPGWRWCCGRWVLLPVILKEMEQVTWKLGGSHISLRTR